jgi:hypothetical protein
MKKEAESLGDLLRADRIQTRPGYPTPENLSLKEETRVRGLALLWGEDPEEILTAIQRNDLLGRLLRRLCQVEKQENRGRRPKDRVKIDAYITARTHMLHAGVQGDSIPEWVLAKIKEESGEQTISHAGIRRRIERGKLILEKEGLRALFGA